MGVRGEHRDAVTQAGQRDVVDVAAEALQEALILNSPHSCPTPNLAISVRLFARVWFGAILMESQGPRQKR